MAILLLQNILKQVYLWTTIISPFYINDFCKNVLSEDFMFADDTSLFNEIRNNMHYAASVVNTYL